MNFCKTIRDKYNPYVMPLYSSTGGFCWKGFYLSVDKTKFREIGFAADTHISKDQQEKLLNKYLIKREKTKTSWENPFSNTTVLGGASMMYTYNTIRFV